MAPGGATTAAPSGARPGLLASTGKRLRGAAAILLTMLVSGCADRTGDGLIDDANQVQLGDPVPYTVAIEGVDEDLEAYLTTVSESAAGTAEPPRSLIGLRRRAVADEERLVQALGGEGYYDARVRAAVEPAPEEGDEARISFQIETGPRYTLGAVVLQVAPTEAPYTAPTASELGIEAGAPAVAQAVLDAETALLGHAREAAFAYAELGPRQAIIDRDAKTLDVTLNLDPGPSIVLGPPEFTGVDGVDRAFLEARVAWTEGTPFSPEALERTRRDLVDTALFNVVDVTLPETPPATGAAPVTIRTEQRLHRTISAGIRFESDAGPGADVGWEHRNAFGAGERLRAEFDVDPLAQSLATDLRTPDFYGRSRSFLAEASAAREDTDAFESLALHAAAGVEQRLTPQLSGSLGLGFQLSEVTEEDEDTESFALLFVPTTLRFDNTGRPLDPVDGFRASLEAAPFWDVLGPDLTFQRVRIDGSTYVQLTEDPRLIFAVRGALGSIFGAERDAIPANRRYYSGGGGSVRGVPFQTASPLDEDDDPVGGRSLLELSSELRLRFTETLGAVAFVDAGRAFEATFPDFEDPLIVGAGAGFRYFTPIGPVRLDVAVPVDRRDVDDAFQFYVSLGEAF